MASTLVKRPKANLLFLLSSIGRSRVQIGNGMESNWLHETAIKLDIGGEQIVPPIILHLCPFYFCTVVGPYALLRPHFILSFFTFFFLPNGAQKENPQMLHLLLLFSPLLLFSFPSSTVSLSLSSPSPKGWRELDYGKEFTNKLENI